MSVNILRKKQKLGNEASYIRERVNMMCVQVMEEDARVMTMAHGCMSNSKWHAGCPTCGLDNT